MSDPFIGEIRMFGFGTRGAPNGWQACDGSLLSIAEYEVLFVLIGTTYGGDGQTTFAVPDLRGRVPSSSVAGSTAQLDVEQLYRLERATSACANPDFPKLVLQAAGHGPEWNVKVAGKGMVIERAGQPALALPYLEEQLGDGRFNLSSEANEQHVELWVAPQRCVDPTRPSVQFMSAELRVNDQVQRGCAYFGGARSD